MPMHASIPLMTTLSVTSAPVPVHYPITRDSMMPGGSGPMLPVPLAALQLMRMIVGCTRTIYFLRLWALGFIMPAPGGSWTPLPMVLALLLLVLRLWRTVLPMRLGFRAMLSITRSIPCIAARLTLPSGRPSPTSCTSSATQPRTRLSSALIVINGMSCISRQIA